MSQQLNKAEQDFRRAQVAVIYFPTAKNKRAEKRARRVRDALVLRVTLENAR